MPEKSSIGPLPDDPGDSWKEALRALPDDADWDKDDRPNLPDWHPKGDDRTSLPDEDFKWSDKKKSHPSWMSRKVLVPAGAIAAAVVGVVAMVVPRGGEHEDHQAEPVATGPVPTVVAPPTSPATTEASTTTTEKSPDQMLAEKLFHEAGLDKPIAPIQITQTPYGFSDVDLSGLASAIGQPKPGVSAYETGESQVFKNMLGISDRLAYRGSFAIPEFRLQFNIITADTPSDDGTPNTQSEEVETSLDPAALTQILRLTREETAAAPDSVYKQFAMEYFQKVADGSQPVHTIDLVVPARSATCYDASHRLTAQLTKCAVAGFQSSERSGDIAGETSVIAVSNNPRGNPADETISHEWTHNNVRATQTAGHQTPSEGQDDPQEHQLLVNDIGKNVDEKYHLLVNYGLAREPLHAVGAAGPGETAGLPPIPITEVAGQNGQTLLKVGATTIGLTLS
jgi:hypothetical protein